MNKFSTTIKKIIATLLMATVLFTNTIPNIPYSNSTNEQISVYSIEDPDLGDGYNH